MPWLVAKGGKAEVNLCFCFVATCQIHYCIASKSQVKLGDGFSGMSRAAVFNRFWGEARICTTFGVALNEIPRHDRFGTSGRIALGHSGDRELDLEGEASELPGGSAATSSAEQKCSPRGFFDGKACRSREHPGRMSGCAGLIRFGSCGGPEAKNSGPHPRGQYIRTSPQGPNNKDLTTEANNSGPHPERPNNSGLTPDMWVYTYKTCMFI